MTSRLLVRLAALAAVAVFGTTMAKIVPVFKSIRLRNCDDDDGYPNHFVWSKVTRPSTYVSLMSGDFLVTKPGNNNLKLVCEVFKCEDRDGAKCKPSVKLNFDQMCDMIKMKGKAWSPIFANFKPTIECPFIADTTYRMRNATIDTEAASKIIRLVSGVEKYYWKIKGTVIKNGRSELACIEYMVKVDQIEV
ncbi:hypothetical protein AAG570_011473 [Ranatra chinensis]|uniref:MD-2-related lipid-recognition domain-containing protein n=1 Tax=Ranatra chinensis TaxID=642074 RepID=A0ABD0YWY9_9HEMI